jgi:hypothetical protein
MSQRKNKSRDRKIGKQPEKKPLIDPRYKNTFWTVVVIIILIIFFIVNNTRTEPKQGPYPPNYSPQKAQKELDSTAKPIPDIINK